VTRGVARGATAGATPGGSIRAALTASGAVAALRARRSAVAAVRQNVHDAGWKWAQSLELVIDAVLLTDRAPTLDEVHSRARTRAPRVTSAAVRHAVDVLLQLGIVRHLDDPRGPQRIVFRGPRAGARPQVVVARCRSCGRSEDVPSTWLIRLKADVWRKLGYELEDPLIELTGRCPACPNAGHRPVS